MEVVGEGWYPLVISRLRAYIMIMVRNGRRGAVLCLVILSFEILDFGCLACSLGSVLLCNDTLSG
jgi:hypothetical protein